MINYLNTKCEINLIKSRLEILKMKKEELQSLVDPNSALIDEIRVQSSPESDKKIVEYIFRLSKIDEEIEKKESYLNFLEQKLNEMEKYLREAKGMKRKIFVMKHLDGLRVRKIAEKLHYSEWNIYRILKIIENETFI